MRKSIVGDIVKQILSWECPIGRLVIPLLSCLLILHTLKAQETEYVEAFSGDLPVVLCIEHAGWKTVGSVPVGPSMSDTLLREYTFRFLLPAFYEHTGKLPLYICQQGRRDYVNCNRFIGDPESFGSPEAEAAYMDYHSRIESAVASLESRFGDNSGYLINLHTTDLPQSFNNAPWDRIAEIGFGTTVQHLDSPWNTMTALYNRIGSQALIGSDSVPYHFYHANEWPTAYSVWPPAAALNSKNLTRLDEDVWHVLPAFVFDGLRWVDSYYLGEATIFYHGTNRAGHHMNWINGLDAFQIEFNVLDDSGLKLPATDPRFDPLGSANQLDPVFALDCARTFVGAVIDSHQSNFEPEPDTAYCVIVDNNTDGFTSTGLWQPSTALGYWGPEPSRMTGTAGDSASWTPDLLTAGLYEVFVRWTRAGTRTSRAIYTVEHASGSSTQIMDQNGPLDARWNSLGVFPFQTGTGGCVKLTAGDAYPANADAVLFRHVSTEPPPPNLPPVARIISSCGEPVGNSIIGMFDTAEFDGVFSIDPDGSIAQYHWDFGDGGAVDDIHVYHAYDRSGNYTVRLTVTDDRGASDTESILVRVLPRTLRIDDGRMGFSVNDGSHWKGSAASGAYGLGSIESDIPGAVATWTCPIEISGLYEVFARWTHHPNRCTDTVYTIEHSAGVTEIVQDQTTGGGTWNSLGFYTLEADSNARIRISGTHDERSISADAVQWVRVPENEDLKVYYNCETVSGNSVRDMSEYQNDGTNMGASVIPGGVQSQALHFDGVDDYCFAGPDIISRFPFSFSLWLRTTLPASANRRIIELADRTGQGSVYSLFISYGDPSLGAVAPGYTWTDVSSNIDVNDGQWHHIAGVFASDSNKRLYVDGTLRAVMSESIPSSALAQYLTIGRDGDSNPNPDRYFEGDLDEIRVFNKALQPSEIHALAMTPTPVPEVTGTATPTRTPTVTPTISPTRTPSLTPTITPTPTLTPEPTGTPTKDPSVSPSPVPPEVPTTGPASILITLCVLSLWLMMKRSKLSLRG